MIVVILILSAHYTERLIVIITIVMQPLSMSSAKVILCPLNVRLFHELQNAMLLMLRVRKVDIKALLA
jgi:hypothetical protein